MSVACRRSITGCLITHVLKPVFLHSVDICRGATGLAGAVDDCKHVGVICEESWTYEFSGENYMHVTGFFFNFFFHGAILERVMVVFTFGCMVLYSPPRLCYNFA